MADNNITYTDKKAVNITEIWTSQTLFMHTWLVVSFAGLIALYWAMSITVVSI